MRQSLLPSRGEATLMLEPVREFALALNGAWDAQAFAIFRNRTPCDLDAFFAEDFDDAVVGKNFDGRFGVDQAFDLVTHGFG